MKPVIAQSSTSGLHSIVRVVDNNLRNQTSINDSVDKFNELVSAKTLIKLVEAIDGLPPLLPSAEISVKGKKQKRIYGVDEFRKRYKKLFIEEMNRSHLEYESYFYTNNYLPEPDEERAAPSAATRRMLIFNGDFERDLCMLDSSQCKIIVEPLLDWTYARNVFNISARILSLLEDGIEDETLEKAGFEYYKDKKLFYIPFSFTPYWRPLVPTFDGFMDKMGDSTIHQPLLFASAGLKGKMLFGSDKTVHLKSYQQLTDTFVNLANLEAETERRHFLCVEATGESQAVTAKRLVRAFLKSAKELKVSRKREGFLGWKEDLSSVFGRPAAPLYTPASLFSSLMYQLAYRGETKIAMCKECGSPILCTWKGPKREYCSNACRMREIRREAKGGK
jgi:hypothetical protein